MSPAAAQKWLDALQAGWLNPPQDVHDRKAWDGYWQAHIEFGPMDVRFGDFMSSDPTFLPVLERRGVRTVLCAGNGLSSESWALALHGFHVTTLDISTVPRAVLRDSIADAAHKLHRLRGLVVNGDDAISFNPAVPIRSEDCPKIHQTDQYQPRGGGSLTYVTGDLTDAGICPGPFDVIIERRTVQLFPPGEQRAAFERLTGRLAPHGLLVSHEHRGNWKPPEPRDHFAGAWTADCGLTQERSLEAGVETRAVRLIFTSG